MAARRDRGLACDGLHAAAVIRPVSLARLIRRSRNRRLSIGAASNIYLATQRRRDEMKVLRIAAFCDGDGGGNPAGVVVGQELPSEAEMRRVAAEVGFSET